MTADAHEAAVARLRDAYAAWPPGAPVRLAKRTSNLFRFRDSDPATPPDAKASLVESLLSGKVSPVSLNLITQVLSHPRGRSPQVVLDLCASIAARRREQLIAVVRVATELSAAQRKRLADALTNTYGQGIHLNVVHDPAVIGGMSVQIGDELVDGTTASRLAEVRRNLTS